MLYAAVLRVLAMLRKIYSQNVDIKNGQKQIEAGQVAILAAEAANTKLLQQILTEVSPPLPGPLASLSFEFGTPEVQP